MALVLLGLAVVVPLCLGADYLSEQLLDKCPTMKDKADLPGEERRERRKRRGGE